MFSYEAMIMTYGRR